ncbi:MAG TPA: alpha/beta fold hydrolase [Pirellulales bacterium]|nr:alpha/beta fold hydrolase [Pirellulales bacterium]
MPIQLSPPAPPNALWKGKDLSSLMGPVLAGAAREAAQKGNYVDAVTLQYWAVHTNDRGRYDLACYYSRIGDVDSAIYWLQDASLSDGVDAEWAGRDYDLDAVRSDRRWAQLAPFLAATNQYWASKGQPATSFVMPQELAPGTRVGVVLGLPGLGDNPHSFFPIGYQPFADQLAMAFVAVSGTVPRGRTSFVWAEDVVRDSERVRQALREVAQQEQVDNRRVILLGFSQGAQMAFEIAMTYPEEFAGAIVLSPGSQKPRDLRQIRSSSMHRRQAYVLCCGEREHPMTVHSTRSDASLAEKMGANVRLLITPGASAHTFPPNFRQQLPEWVHFIESQRRTQPSEK